MIHNDLRTIQLIQLDILKEFDAVCKKNNLTYWLDGGTILGAVRHGGFIPWDDDLDVAMPSEDYNKFLQIAESELPKNISLQTNQTDSSSHLKFAKLRDNNSLYIEHGDDFTLPYQKGIYMDIFEFVYYPDISRKTIRFFYKMVTKTTYELSVKHYLSLKTVAQYFVFNLQRAIFKPIWELLCKSETKKYICNPIENNGYCIKHLSDNIFPIGTINFEGLTFNAPQNPDGYLKTLYGDYMKLPPENKRKGHAFMYFSNLQN